MRRFRHLTAHGWQRRAPLFLAILLAAFALLLLFPGLGHAQTESVLLSNAGQTTTGNDSVDRDLSWIAQPFTTGPSSRGYELTAVAVKSSEALATLPAIGVTLRSHSADRPSDTALATFTNPSQWIAGLNVFTLASPETLDPGTTYYIHIAKASSGSVKLDYVVTLDADSGATDGWSFGRRCDVDVTCSVSFDIVSQITLYGTTNAVNVTAPAAIGLMAAPASDREVALSWRRPSNGGSAITRFEYRWKTTGSYGGWTTIPGSGPRTTSYTVPSLINGRAYTFQVRAVNKVGNAPDSNEATARAGVPHAPPYMGFGDIKFGGQGDDYIVVGWAPALGNPTGYEVQWTQYGGTSWQAVSPPHRGTGIRYKHEGLLPNRSYVYRVRGVNSAGAGPWSTVEGEYQTKDCRQGADTRCELSVGKVARPNGHIKKNWSGTSVGSFRAKSPDVDWYKVALEEGLNYRVYMHGSPTGAGTLMEVAEPVIYGGMPSAELDPVEIGGGKVYTPTSDDDYFVAVVAAPGGYDTLRGIRGSAEDRISYFLNVGDGSYVVEVIQVAAAPTNLNFGAFTSSGLPFTWNPPADTGGQRVNGYQVRYKKTSDSDWGEWRIVSGGASARRHVISSDSIDSSASYEFQLAAYHQVTESRAVRGVIAEVSWTLPQTGQQTGQQRSQPLKSGAPTGLSAAVSYTRVDLEWTPTSPGSTGYEVQWLSDGVNGWQAAEPAHKGAGPTIQSHRPDCQQDVLLPCAGRERLRNG